MKHQKVDDLHLDDGVNMSIINTTFMVQRPASFPEDLLPKKSKYNTGSVQHLSARYLVGSSSIQYLYDVA